MRSLLALPVLFLAAASADAANPPRNLGGNTNRNLVEVLSGAPNFSLLVDAVVQAGLADTLQTAGPFTLFAPTNRAFLSLPPQKLQVLLDRPDVLLETLLYHGIGDTFTAADVVGHPVSPTLTGRKVRFTVDDGCVRVNQSNVIAVDYETSNGVIHVIDRVLLPCIPALDQGDCAQPNLVQLLDSNPEFSTLATAVRVAGLAETLSSGGNFTVFAPTNAAFDALPGTVLQDLLNDPPALANVLLYHVFRGVHTEKEVATFDRFRTLQGSFVEFSTDGIDLFVNDSTIVGTDILAGNGVAHVISSVLVP